MFTTLGRSLECARSEPRPGRGAELRTPWRRWLPLAGAALAAAYLTGGRYSNVPPTAPAPMRPTEPDWTSMLYNPAALIA